MGQEDHPVVVHRVGTGQLDPGQGKVEDFRSSCGMQNLSCRRRKTEENWFAFVCFIYDHIDPFQTALQRALH